MLFSQDSRLSEAVFSDPGLIPVINRLGIDLGFGDKQIWEICSERQISLPFFLAIINTFIHDDYMPEDVSDSFKISDLLDYLVKTNRYYSETQIPNIERHFVLLSQRSGKGNNVDYLFKFFMQVKDELIRCIDEDDSKWFPKIIEKSDDTLYTAEQVSVEGDYSDLLPDNLGEAFSGGMGVEDKLADLASIFIRHIKGKYDENLAVAVINSIFSLHKDISQNNRIRNRILLPAVCRLFSINTSL